MINSPAGLFINQNGAPVPDIIMDDQSLGYLTDKGWLMTSGCGHSGLINTGKVLQSIKDEPIYSIVGGFHLWQADSETLNRTANWLASQFAVRFSVSLSACQRWNPPTME